MTTETYTRGTGGYTFSATEIDKIRQLQEDALLVFNRPNIRIERPT
jgi:hypothetical protein